MAKIKQVKQLEEHWAIVHPDQHLLPCTLRKYRHDAIGEYIEFRATIPVADESWKQLRRRGYKAVRVCVLIME